MTKVEDKALCNTQNEVENEYRQYEKERDEHGGGYDHKMKEIISNARCWFEYMSQTQDEYTLQSKKILSH